MRRRTHRLLALPAGSSPVEMESPACSQMKVHGEELHTEKEGNAPITCIDSDLDYVLIAYMVWTILGYNRIILRI